MKPEFHPAAEQEFSASVDWYEVRAPGLGAQMRNEVGRAIVLLCDRHTLGIPFGNAMRQLPLRRFPYTLIYRISGDNLRIIAIAHSRRRPGYWSGRR